MGRYYGEIGFATQKETAPGVWQDVITPRSYFGDVIRNLVRSQGAETLNDNLNVDNKISIVSDHFADENFSMIRYVTWLGNKWKVTSVEVLRPRLVLTIGGVYNEQT